MTGTHQSFGFIFAQSPYPNNHHHTFELHSSINKKVSQFVVEDYKFSFSIHLRHFEDK